jgi:NADH:ubiquinone reductase (H+-translocating)
VLTQVAIPSGRHAARSITPQISGHQARPFRYRDLGTMATIGRNDAVTQIGPLRLSGFAGWLAWLLVHIVRTVGLPTRASVVISWISGYLFADRPARLITGPRRDSPEARPAPPAPSGGRSPERTVSPGQVEESRTRPA